MKRTRVHVSGAGRREEGGRYSQVYLLAIASSVILYRDLEHLWSQVAWRTHQLYKSTTPHITRSHSTHTHTSTHSHTRAHTHTHIHTHTHTHTHTHSKHIHTRAHTHTHTHRHTHTHTHTHPHLINIPVRVSPSFNLTENPNLIPSNLGSHPEGYTQARGRRGGRGWVD